MMEEKDDFQWEGKSYIFSGCVYEREARIRMEEIHSQEGGAVYPGKRKGLLGIDVNPLKKRGVLNSRKERSSKRIALFKPWTEEVKASSNQVDECLVREVCFEKPSSWEIAIKGCARVTSRRVLKRGNEEKVS